MLGSIIRSRSVRCVGFCFQLNNHRLIHPHTSPNTPRAGGQISSRRAFSSTRGRPQGSFRLWNRKSFLGNGPIKTVSSVESSPCTRTAGQFKTVHQKNRRPALVRWANSDRFASLIDTLHYSYSSITAELGIGAFTSVRAGACYRVDGNGSTADIRGERASSHPPPPSIRCISDSPGYEQ